MMAYKIGTYSAVKNLLIGLWVTLKYLFSHAITLQYPTERWPMPERSRAMVVLLSDPETGKLNCTACTLCAKACPCAAITVGRERGEDKRWILTEFTLDNTICCYCGLCEEACNFDALMMVPKYEYSTYDKPSLVFDVHTLQEWGRDVKYTPRPKKKKAVAKPVEKKPTAEAETAPDGEEKKTESAKPDTADAEVQESQPAAETPEADEPKPDQDDKKE